MPFSSSDSITLSASVIEQRWNKVQIIDESPAKLIF